MVKTKKYKSRKHNSNQKMKIQYGCSANLGQNGGSSFLREFSNKILPPVPPALVGPNWSPTSIGSNHYAKNNYNSQVDYNPGQERNQINLSVNPWGKMWGGKKTRRGTRRRTRGTRRGTRRKTRRQNGGSIIDKIMPSELLNIGRTASWNAGNVYNGYNGYKPSVSPMPWTQPALLQSAYK